MMESVIPFWETDENGRLVRLELLAIELGLGTGKGRAGVPRPAADDAILRRFAAMSAPYGVEMEISGNRAIVKL